MRACAREWYLKHLAERKAYIAEYRRTNSEALRAYRERVYQIGPLKPQGELSWLRKHGKILRTARQIIREEKPRSITIARGGITNSFQLLNLITATMGDVLSGSVTPTMGNSAFTGSRAVLKLLELQVKYGKPQADSHSKVLEIGHDLYH